MVKKEGEEGVGLEAEEEGEGEEEEGVAVEGDLVRWHSNLVSVFLC